MTLTLDLMTFIIQNR